MGANTKTYEPGEHLFNEGDRSDCIFVINQGLVSIQKSRGSGQVELAKIKPGEVIGEMAFFDRKARSASAVASLKTEATVISFEALDKLYASVPNYFRTIMSATVERLRAADERVRLLQKTMGEGGGGESDESK